MRGVDDHIMVPLTWNMLEPLSLAVQFCTPGIFLGYNLPLLTQLPNPY